MERLGNLTLESRDPTNALKMCNAHCANCACMPGIEAREACAGLDLSLVLPSQMNKKLSGVFVRAVLRLFVHCLSLGGVEPECDRENLYGVSGLGNLTTSRLAVPTSTTSVTSPPQH